MEATLLETVPSFELLDSSCLTIISASDVVHVRDSKRHHQWFSSSEGGLGQESRVKINAETSLEYSIMCKVV
jgi:hypothetical protein